MCIMLKYAFSLTGIIILFPCFALHRKYPLDSFPLRKHLCCVVIMSSQASVTCERYMSYHDGKIPDGSRLPANRHYSLNIDIFIVILDIKNRR